MLQIRRLVCCAAFRCNRQSVWYSNCSMNCRFLCYFGVTPVSIISELLAASISSHWYVQYVVSHVLLHVILRIAGLMPTVKIYSKLTQYSIVLGRESERINKRESINEKLKIDKVRIYHLNHSGLRVNEH